MKVFFRVAVLNVFVAAGFISYFSSNNLSKISAQSIKETSNVSDAKREDAYRANNLGVALLEQFNHKEGAEAFRRALTIDPKLKIARINLAVRARAESVVMRAEKHGFFF